MLAVCFYGYLLFAMHYTNWSEAIVYNACADVIAVRFSSISTPELFSFAHCAVKRRLWGREWFFFWKYFLTESCLYVVFHALEIILFCETLLSQKLCIYIFTPH